jgi:hypothetical protein
MKAETAAPKARIVLAKGDLKSCFSIPSVCHGADSPQWEFNDNLRTIISAIAR